MFEKCLWRPYCLVSVRCRAQQRKCSKNKATSNASWVQYVQSSDAFMCTLGMWCAQGTWGKLKTLGTY